MSTILTAMLAVTRYLLTAVSFLLIDLPLKVILFIIFITWGLVVCLFYPLVKHVEWPTWFDTLYDYVTEKSKLISKKVYNLWK